MLDKNCDECRFSNMGSIGNLECRRHSPVVMANPRYSDSDHQVALTEYPNAYGPCGDFEVEVCDHEWDNPISGTKTCLKCDFIGVNV